MNWQTGRVDLRESDREDISVHGREDLAPFDFAL
jgi:hypothetical protein